MITASQSAAAVGATYSGEIRARYESKLGFKVSGKVIARLVEVGSKVVPGQVLLELDPQDASLSAASAAAQTEAARAKLQQSCLDLDREDRLYRERFISKAALDQFQLTYDTALSQLRSAEAQQQQPRTSAHTVLKADRAGVITSIEVEGTWSRPDAGVDRCRGRRARVRDRTGISRRRDPTARHECEHLGQSATSMGRARELAPDADKATRTYAARITIRDPDARCDSA